MKHKIVEKPAMKFVGIGVDTSVQKAPADCPVVWESFMKRYKEIENYTGGMKNYGVCTEPNEGTCQFRYCACAEVSEFGSIPDGMEKVEIPAQKFMVFEHKGKLAKLGETYGKIMGFMKAKGMKEGKCWVEFYDHRWTGDKEESVMEIWCSFVD